MFPKIYMYLKAPAIRRVLMIGLLLMMAFAATTGFVWVETNPVIAPPGLRMLTWFWSLFQF
jgi:hypothetical protein